jgi:SNF2 family DNA or RNA helicase
VFKWRALVVDEAHRLKNDDTVLYGILQNFKRNFSLLMTGTPLQNDPGELWALLHFAVPSSFKDRYAFLTLAEEDPSGLKDKIRPYMLRRTKAEISIKLPGKTDSVIFTGMFHTISPPF